MTTTDPVITISRDEFRNAVRRNIRSLLAMTEADQQQLAAVIDLSASKLSERLTGRAGWQGEELVSVARAFNVGTDAVVAMTVEEFHQALDGVTPVIHGLTDSVQLNLLDFAA